MRTFLGVSVVAVCVIGTAVWVRAASDPPAWAYGLPPLAPGEVAAAPTRGGGGRAAGAAGGAPGTNGSGPGAGAAGAAVPGGPAPAGNPAGATGGNAGAGGNAAGRAAGAAGGRGADPTPRQAQGSTLQFTTTEINDGYGPADWFPMDHPPMPDLVAHGKRDQGARACALCHLPNGKGRPENAPVAGQGFDYIVQQLHDFKDDLRHTSDPRKTNTNDMAIIARTLSDDDMKVAATYFSSMKWTPWIRVVETDTVPKTRIQGNIFFSLGDGTTEPIGMRIIETPEDTAQAQLRNPRIGFIAYVPTGSVKRGETLATTGGNGKTLVCSSCHGPDLNGLGPVPGIAGRSPSYLVRQMYDLQSGARHGTWSALMKPVVANLTEDDLINLAAYVSSRP